MCRTKTCDAVAKLLAMCCVGRGCNGCNFCIYALRLSTYTIGSGTEIDFVGLANSPGMQVNHLCSCGCYVSLRTPRRTSGKHLSMH